MVFLGSILVYDMRQPTAPPVVLVFPDGDKKPIIGYNWKTTYSSNLFVQVQRSLGLDFSKTA